VHARFYVLELAFPEISDGPPGAGVNERENAFAHVSVGAFGDGEIGYARVERRINAAIIEIVASSFHGGLLCASLVDQRFQSGDGMLGLLVLSQRRF
jgi:hypothetical protein